jgi:nitrite reductase (NADH) small subunit
VSHDDWTDVGGIDDIPRRGARRVMRGAAIPIAVFRTAGDEVFALVDRCPHKGGPLSEGIVQACAVACPLHGWVINLADGHAEAPDEGRSDTVPIKRVGDRILLSLPSVDARRGGRVAAPARRVAPAA